MCNGLKPIYDFPHQIQLFGKCFFLGVENPE